MDKESWYARSISDVDVIRISESDDWIIDYDKSRGMYRVSYFQDNHFVDEHWFDAYEEKEVSLSEALKNYELVECKFTDEELKGLEKFIDKWNSIGCTSFNICDEKLNGI